jgi:type I restriction enzyme S subunit
MIADWKETTLGDVISLQRGYDLPEYERSPGSVPVYGSFGITGFHDSARAKGPGVTIGRSGASVGVVSYSPTDFWPHNTVLFVTDFKGNHERFVSYLLRTVALASLNSGSAQPSLNRNFVYPVRVRIPAFDLQRRIADILSAYDDLIENNSNRISLLEEMARAVYREWFVHFRFPGHERLDLVESPLGPIPEGWEWVGVGNVSRNFDRKRKPLSKMQREKMKGAYPYYGAAKVFDYVNDYLFDGEYLLLAEDGSVMTADGQPVLQLAFGKFWANNHTHILQGVEPVSTEHLYLSLSDLDVRGYITGAAQPKITQANLNRMPFLRAGEALLRKFAEIVAPFFAERNCLERMGDNLRATREFLLPKLISGEIDVSEADEPAEAIA